MVLVSYNIMALFRIVALKDKKSRRIATLYLKCIASGGWVVFKQRKTGLKLSVAPKKRAWMEAMFKNISDFEPDIKIYIDRLGFKSNLGYICHYNGIGITSCNTFSAIGNCIDFSISRDAAVPDIIMNRDMFLQNASRLC